MSSKKIVLVSSDGESFEVEEVVARKLQIVGHMIDDDCADKPIPLQNVTGKILAMVIEYCKTHVDDVADDDKEESEEAKKKKADSTSGEEADKKKLAIETWDKEFLEDIDSVTVFQLILAANYLNVKGLLDLTCQNVADYIKNKTVEEVREIFGIVNDYTEEEERKVREENAWAFQDDPKP